MTILIYFLLYLLPKDFKIFLPFFCLVAIYIFFYTKKRLSLTILLLLIISSNFDYVGKIFEIQIIRPGIVYEEPFYTNGVSNDYGIKTAEIITLILLISTILNFKNIFTGKYTKIFIISSVLYFLVSTYWSLHNSFDPVFSLISLLTQLRFPLAALAIKQHLSNKEEPKEPLANIIVASVIFQFFVSLWQFLSNIRSYNSNLQFEFRGNSPEESLVIGRPFGTLVHANQLAYIIFVLILVLPYLKVISNKFIYPLSACIIIFSMSRYIWLCSTIKLTTELLKNNNIVKKIRLFKRHIIFSLTTSVLLMLLILPRIFNLEYTLDEQGGSLNIRVLMTQEAIELISSAPLVGYGTNTSLYMLHELFPLGYTKTFPVAIHNSILQIWIESGLIGVIFFLTPVLLLLRKSIWSFFANPLRDNKYLNISIILFTTIIYFLTQPYSSVAYITTGIGVGLALYLFDHEEKRNI